MPFLRRSSHRGRVSCVSQMHRYSTIQQAGPQHTELPRLKNRKPRFQKILERELDSPSLTHTASPRDMCVCLFITDRNQHARHAFPPGEASFTRSGAAGGKSTSESPLSHPRLAATRAQRPRLAIGACLKTACAAAGLGERLAAEVGCPAHGAGGPRFACHKKRS